jgi:hypothetical protein
VFYITFDEFVIGHRPARRGFVEELALFDFCSPLGKG